MPLIELDMIIAFINQADKLHYVASKLFDMIVKERLTGITIPVSALLEYELILKSRGYPETTIRSDLEAIKNLENIKIIPLTLDCIIEASRLREIYGLSYFDSLHAASALLYDKTVISVDKAYDKIQEIKRIDPVELIKGNKQYLNL